MKMSDTATFLTPAEIASRTDELQSSERTLVAPIITQYWHTILRWKWAIIGIIIAALVLGLLATLLTAPRYTAHAQIEISREQKNITKVEGVESAEAGRDLEFYETQYALLQADSLTERVARKIGLARNDAFFKAHGVDLDPIKMGVASSGRLTKTQSDAREKVAISLLKSFVTISPVRKSRLVNIAYTSQSPEFAAQVANTWSQQFIESSMDRQFSSTAEARKFLEDRLTNLRGRLEQSERDVVAYASQKDIVTLNNVRDAEGKTQIQRTLVASDLEALNAALTEAISDRIAAESKASDRQSGDASPEALSNSAISELRKRRAEVAAEYAKLMVQFEPGYPAARALAEQQRSLDGAIARETARVSSSRTAAYSEALRRERDLRARVGDIKKRLDAQQGDSIQYNVFQREADTNRQLYDALLQRYKEIGVAGVVAANNIVIVDQAKVPESPSAPSMIKNMAVALALGLLLAGIAAVALEQIDEGVREPGQIRRLLNLPLLGDVPETTANAVETLDDPKSHLSESYFSIRSNLAFTTAHGLPKSFMITSTRPAEGKSTSALALATIIGRTGKSVLLVDADMRSPSVHLYAGQENKAGLSNLLAGFDKSEELVLRTNYKGVSILPAGPTPPSAAELLSNERLKSLVKDLLTRFDYVVVDAPPVLGLSDAPLIGQAVEGCVYVIQAEGVAVRAIQASLDRLRMADVHIFGGILTKLKLRQSNYGYGYGYGDKAEAK
jgi:polysaccharide biosynthesis transport protein